MTKPMIRNSCIKMSDEEYFAIDALSNSDFRLLKESPLHLANKELFKLKTKSLNIGSAVHCLVLEPDEFGKRYAIEEFDGCDLNKNSKAYKEAKNEWLKTVKDKEILSADDFDKIAKMARNVKAIAGGLLQRGVAEHAFFAELDGIQCKCKADYYIEKHKVAFDLKTTASIKDFSKSLLEYNYGTQSAFYSDVMSESGYTVERFIFILVETTAPYMVSVKEITQESLEEGRAIYSKLLTEWKEFKRGVTPQVIKKTSYPHWYMEKVREGA